MTQSTPEFGLQIIVTHGPEDPSKAILALALAMAAASSEIPVVIFFTLKGVLWLDPNIGDFNPEPQFGGSEEYLQALPDIGITVEGCSACVMQYCSHLLDEASGQYRLREGVTLTGLSAVSVRATTVQTLTF